MFLEYLYIFKYFFIAFILAVCLFAISFLFVFQLPELEKLSVYECGFNPSGDARTKFEVKFYPIAILFIIFDLELTFLFPRVLCLTKISFIGILGMLFFIFILAVGFVYE